MSTEFQKYRFADFLRAFAVAPLAAIPAVLLVDLLFLFPTDSILPSDLEGFARFRAWAIFLMTFSLPTAYISTAIFGALGFGIANSTRVPLTIPIGALAGVVGGVIAGLLWMLFLWGDNFDLSVLFHGFGLIILLGALFCGLFVGVLYSKLLNWFVQNKSKFFSVRKSFMQVTKATITTSPLERFLAILAAFLCLGVTIALWWRVSAHQGMWPRPGIYFIELVTISLAAAVLFDLGDPLGPFVTWAATGVIGVISYLGAMTIGFYYLPIALLFAVISVTSDVRNKQHIPAHLGIFVIAGIAQWVSMLAAI